MICSEQRENATYISKLDWNRRVAARIRRFSPPIDEILMEVAVSRCGSQLIMSIEELLMTSPFLARLAGFHFFHDLHDSLVSTSSTTCTTHWFLFSFATCNSLVSIYSTTCPAAAAVAAAAAAAGCL